MKGYRTYKVADYYKSPVAQQVCHRIKDGDMSAIAFAASGMAKRVRKTDVLVPVPSRSGRSTVTLDLCNAISSFTGCRVVDALEGDEHESLYALKKKGVDIRDKDLGFRLRESLPPQGRILVVDNVYDTGHTAGQAVRAIGRADVLVYARVSTLAAAPPATGADVTKQN